MGQRRPAGSGFGRQAAAQGLVEQCQPDGEMLGPDIARCHMHLHRIAVIAGLVKDRLLPEPRDLVFVLRPVGDMGGKDRSQNLMTTHGTVKYGHDSVDLFGGYGETRWQHGDNLVLSPGQGKAFTGKG